MNKILLAKYTEPTDIFILGDASEETDPNFYLTDDECTINIVRGSNRVRGSNCECITTFGFGFILTTEELINAVSNIEYETIGEGIFLEEFTGEIYAVVESSSGLVEFNEDVDLKEYLYYQLNSDEDVEISLLIKDEKSWGNFFYYRAFPIEMIRKIITTTKKIS